MAFSSGWRGGLGSFGGSKGPRASGVLNCTIGPAVLVVLNCTISLDTPFVDDGSPVLRFFSRSRRCGVLNCTFLLDTPFVDDALSVSWSRRWGVLNCTISLDTPFLVTMFSSVLPVEPDCVYLTVPLLT